jgi:hypothetical protein
MTVQQGGVVTQGHVAAWAINGVIEDAGTATEPKVNSLGLYGNGGLPLGITNSAYPWPFTGATTTLGMGVSQTSAYTEVYGTQDLPYQIIVNGTVQATFGPNGAEINLASPLPVGSGGTGLSATPTNGQLLIGNGAGYTLGTLTAGVGISVLEGAGSVTINATGTAAATLVIGASPVTGGTVGDILVVGAGNIVSQTASPVLHGTITFAP